MSTRRVLITVPERSDIFQADIMSDLESSAEVIHNELGRAFTTAEVAERAADCDAVITSWGSAAIDMSVVEAAPKLRIISHAAGSIKHLFGEEIFEAGVTITNAASVMATYVGEFALALTLTMMRTLPRYAFGAPHGAWDDILCAGNETLYGKTVGIIGLSHTGRAFLRLLAPFNCNVIVYDPYASENAAEDLGIKLVCLEELLSSSKVISLHAPITEETKGMLGADKLKLISNGAVFINTARGILIDHDALASELSSGRFKAALDVTWPEPLPQDHALRRLPNVFIAGHIAGPTTDGRRDMFRCVVDDLKLFWAGERPKNLVTRQMLRTMA
ncbi:MAG: hydroxyacid dehydrogenase [Armatimonadetes bacterium]|nr:hydroxyacid dehydrogenase [Armatimonadota bacterium]